MYRKLLTCHRLSAGTFNIFFFLMKHFCFASTLCSQGYDCIDAKYEISTAHFTYKSLKCRKNFQTYSSLEFTWSRSAYNNNLFFSTSNNNKMSLNRIANNFLQKEFQNTFVNIKHFNHHLTTICCLSHAQILVFCWMCDINK